MRTEAEVDSEGMGAEGVRGERVGGKEVAAATAAPGAVAGSAAGSAGSAAGSAVVGDPVPVAGTAETAVAAGRCSSLASPRPLY